MLQSVHCEVTDPSQVGATRREAVDLAAAIGLDETDQGRLALVVTEAASNLIKHAQDGQLLLRAVVDHAGAAVELLALDRGGGLANTTRAFEDGYSTTGTPGQGLGAIRRLADAHEVHSSPRGLALWALVRTRRSAAQAAQAGQAGQAVPVAPPAPIGVVCRPQPGETVCGDAWRAADSGRRRLLMVADGLGHGPLAAQASHAAIAVLDEPGRDLVELVQAAHEALRGTRGAAVGLACIEAHQVGYVGVGNIACRVTTPRGTRQLLSHNGTVGHEMRKVAVFSLPVEPEEGGVVVLHSDGLTSQCSVDAYPGLADRAPALVAGVLYRDYWRGRDDATIVVAHL